MHSKSITIYSLLFLSYVINVFADFTITPNVNPGGNTIISSHTDSGILFEDLGNGSQGIRLRGWGDGLHWDYGNYIKISSEDADLALKQIEVSYLGGNNLDENSDVADLWFRFSGYDSNGTVTYQEIHYADRIISEEVNEYFTFYTVDWGDQIKTYTFTDEFAGSSYIQVEISYQTLIVIKDVNLMPDSDSDGVGDNSDAFPNDTNETVTLTKLSENGYYTLSEIQDLRAGSTMIAVENGTATLSMDIEKSSDLSNWSFDRTTTVDIPIEDGIDTQFYRFKMTE